MLTYMLDASARTPLYEQLYRLIRRDITTGVLKGGERLPSKRRLAEHLEISRITVETAYSQLLAEGYITAEPRRGYFVQQALIMPQHPAAPARPLPQADPPARFRFDFKTNTVDIDCFPFSTWARLSRTVLTDYADRLLHEPPPQGVAELRTAICRYLLDFRGLEVPEEQVIVGAGSEYLLHLLIRLLGCSRPYALENPGYRKLYQIFEANGAAVCPVGLDAGGLRADHLRDAGAVYLTPSHHFPTGVVMPVPRRMQLLQWAAERPERYLIEDDYDSEFRYSSRPMPALKELDRLDRVIYLNTFAKSLAPSLRIGYMVLPAPLMARFRERFSLYSSSVPAFEQHTLARFLESGAFERHISRSRNVYKGRLDALLSALQQSPLAPFLEIHGAEAGLHILVHVKNGLCEEELLQRAEAKGVRVYGLSAYYAPGTRPEQATVILGYAGIASENFREAVQLLSEAWL